MLAREARTPGPEQADRCLRSQLRAVSLAVLSLAFTARLAAQPATLVKDINPGTGLFPTNFRHSYLTRSGNLLYFASDAGGSGLELWKSDGTASGTSLVADVNPGTQTSDYGSGPTALTDVKGTLFFTWGSGDGGSGLWSTDGTAAGTKQLLSASRSVSKLRSVGSQLLFFILDPSGLQLWKSDGTPAGTTMVTPVASSVTESAAVGTQLFFAIGSQLWKSDGSAAGTALVRDLPVYGMNSLTGSGSTLFFNGCDLQHGCELWKSDGTFVGTGFVFDTAPGPTSGVIAGFFPSHGGVFFDANDGSTGIELWFSDGTPSGTKLVADINPGPGDSFPQAFAETPSGVYFSADDGSHGRELWRTNGTTAGTVLVADIFPGPTSSQPVYLTFVGTNLFFEALDPARGYELWKRDETTGILSVVQDVYAFSLVEFQGSLAFWGNNTSTSSWTDALWLSDGTTQGTSKYKTFGVPTGSFPSRLAANGNNVYFLANTLTDAQQVWMSDGSSNGTQPLTDIPFGALGSPGNIHVAGGKTFFTFNGLWVTPGEHQLVEQIPGPAPVSYPAGALGNVLLFQSCAGQVCGLWKSDGTAAGTQVLTEYSQKSLSSAPVVVGQTAYFILNNTYPYELWKTDGTPGGTVFVTQLDGASGLFDAVGYRGLLYFLADYPYGDIWLSDGTAMGTHVVIPGFANRLTVANDLLFFSSSDPTNGFELWVSDGTLGGSHIVKDINPGPSSSNPGSFVGLGGLLYFTADDGVHGAELWRSDGTDPGTYLVLDIRPGSDSALISNLTVSNGVLFFSASTIDDGTELWKSDGTPGGTMLVKDINPGAASSAPSSLTDVGGTLFFAAFDQIHGTELWKSDGTPSGTVLVRDIEPSLNGSYPNGGIELGGILYFAAYEDQHGSELWRSDGTSSGTTLVADLYPGPASGGPFNFVRLGNRLVFSANDETRGREPWVTDLTQAGSFVLKDINPGFDNSYPSDFTEYKGRVYFSADDGTHFRQLWVTDGSSSGTVLFSSVRNPTSFLVSNGYLFFQADPPSGFPQPQPVLWRTDGSLAGTMPLSSIDYSSVPISAFGGVVFSLSNGPSPGLWRTDGTPLGTTRIDTKVFSPRIFSGGAVYGDLFNQTSFAFELWKSTGTSGGSVLLATFPTNSAPRSLTDVNGVLFFAVNSDFFLGNNGTYGDELWKTDGTPSGTVLVKDIWPGSIGSSPDSLLNVGGKLLFEANDGVHGSELWVSDGTPAGTVLLQDINPGIQSSLPGRFASEFTGSSPGLLKIAGTRVFFSATDNLTGTELWSMPMSAICTPPPTPTIMSSQNPSCGNPVTLDAGPGYSSYLWSTGETTRTITVSPLVTTAYNVIVFNATGCRSSATGVQTVDTSLIPPAPVASSNSAICAGQTLQLMASTVPGATYFWTGPNGFNSIQQNPQIPAATAAASGTYQVVAMIGGCDSAPAAAAVVVHPDPSAAISTDTIVCFNSNNNAASVPDAGPGATYSWTIGNGTILSGPGTSSIVFAASGSGNVTLNVTITDANGCSTSNTLVITGAAVCGNHFFTVPPCRAFDTRAADGPPLSGKSDRTIVLANRCGIPLSARAVSANVTITGPTKNGQIVIYPAGISLPKTSSLSFSRNQTRANNAILDLGPSGDIIVHSTPHDESVQLIIDINGYFEP